MRCWCREASATGGTRGCLGIRLYRKDPSCRTAMLEERVNCQKGLVYKGWRRLRAAYHDRSMDPPIVSRIGQMTRVLVTVET
jgi:hypothetical protein